jgi:hypothetical protein
VTPGNVRHTENAPIEPTPRSIRGAKLHGLKLEYYADATKGDVLMLSWPQCDPKDVTFCISKENLIAIPLCDYGTILGPTECDGA